MNSINQPISQRFISRPDFLRILDAGLGSANYRFTRQAALTWLAMFPGDMTVNHFLARSLIGEGKYPAAITILENLVNTDPEQLETTKTLAGAYHLTGSEKLQHTQACIEVLKGGSGRGDKTPAWTAQLSQVRRLARHTDLAGAEKIVHQVVSQQPDLLLAAVMHMHIDKQYQDESTVFQLASLYHERWPDCLIFSLYLAELKMARGEANSAVSLLHQCVSNDLTGQVAERLWGKDHRYKPLWPDNLKIDLQMGVPAEVAGRLGWNQLPQGELVNPPSNLRVDPGMPFGVEKAAPGGPVARKNLESMDVDSLRKVQKSFDKVAKKVKNPSLAHADGRYPVYVIFSSRKGLDTKYGPASREVVVDHMKQLAAQVARRPGWNAVVFMPDDAEIMAGYGLTPVEAVDPWKLKLALADFDKALAKKGQMIGALLIVGGGDVVPFHNLPNPTDDDDMEVPSDNPYATLDANFFVPEWPVGRLPGDEGTDTGLLLEALRASIKYHGKTAKNLLQIGNILRMILDLFRNRFSQPNGKNFGYTAEVWQKSSEVVFKEAGGGHLYNSPPEYFGSIPSEEVLASPLGYFNLHGMSDSPEWYGQRDFNNVKPGPDYPVALTPKNLVKNGRAPEVVYTEACYGGHIQHKTEDEALALKFISVGVLGLVGSTTISYGSVASPLIGADLLGYHFWKKLKEGLTTGEALMQAKIILVKEMNQRQGFLDGEDQKTLISFVLYGDPFVTLAPSKAKVRRVMRAKSMKNIRTICDKRNDDLNGINVTADILYQAKKAVEPYLPGLEQAEMTISQQHVTCDSKSHSCPTSRLGMKVSHPNKADGIVMTFSQKVAVDQITHHHYARVTVNNRGKVVKLVLSR